MLNKDQLRKQVIQYFRSVGSGENIIQCIKQALFLHEKFNPVTLFEIISKGKQKIEPNDISAYLLSHNITFNDDQLRYYLYQCKFRKEITLNDFLQALIPYNADVVRQFKQKYIQALQIREFDAEVQFIYSQLLENQFKFIRTLITIRDQITKNTTKKQIESLVKEDLILKSKPREGRKFHECFQKKDFRLSFHQLRKFLELWIPSTQIIHQFYLLNVMRHLKCDYPFDKIVYKTKRSYSKTDGQKRIRSEKKRNQTNINHDRLKQTISYDHNQYSYPSKYDNFKKSILQQFVDHCSNDKHKLINKKPQNAGITNENFKISRYERNQKGIDGTYLINIFEEIVIKQQRLQNLRKNLAKSNEFNLINLFKLIDIQNKGYITSNNVSEFTLNAKVRFNHMIDFHARQNNRLRFHEFCLIFRPLSKQLNDIIDARPQNKVPNPFKRQTNKLILQILSLTAQMHSNIRQIKQKINIANINIKDLFIFIDLDNKGYLNEQNIKILLGQNNIFCDHKNLKCIMKLFQKKIDQTISQSEFIHFITIKK